MPEPMPVIPLQYAAAEARGRRPSWFFTACAGLGWLACATTWLLIRFHDLRAVMVGGPVIFAAGLVAVVGGLRSRAGWLMAAGAGHCAVCLLFFALVNLLRWGPHESTVPFLNIGAVYCLLSLPVSALATRRLWAPRQI